MTSPTPPAPAAHPAPAAPAASGAHPALEMLVGPGSPRVLPPDVAEHDLAALCAHPPAVPSPSAAPLSTAVPARTDVPDRHGTVVRANMVASVDGGAWGPDHRSGSINDAADWRVFRVLRALADVVLVGAGTARAEGYTPLDVPAGLEHLRPSGRPVELAVVTRSGELPDSLRGAGRPPLVLTTATGAERAARDVPAERVVVVEHDAAGGGPHGEVDLARALAALADRGLRRVLCEGGPHLLADLLAARLVDELWLTTTPLLVGPGPARVVAGPPPAAGASLPPRDAALVHLLRSGSTLLARWSLAGRSHSSPRADARPGLG